MLPAQSEDLSGHQVALFCGFGLLGIERERETNNVGE
jgi:hypothetical protein